MGDGNLSSKNLYSARFKYNSKYLEYINYVSNTLKHFGIIQSGKICKQYHKNFNCYTYGYSSLSYKELLSVYRKWYPKGKKIIPRDLQLTPLVCRQWYIGDGYLYHYKKNKGRPYIRLATCGFTIFDVKWLVNQLNELGFKAKWQLNRNMIGISAYSTKDFLDYIGNCPIDCYQYKWDY